MFGLSTSTSMDNWTHSGWLIYPGHGFGIVEAPPPSAADEITSALTSALSQTGEMNQISEPNELIDYPNDSLTTQAGETPRD